jgi:hypothetical protein
MCRQIEPNDNSVSPRIAQVSYLFSEIVVEDGIVVAQQVARTLVKGALCRNLKN